MLQLCHSASYCVLVSPILCFSEFSLDLPFLLSHLLFLTSFTPCPNFSSCPNLDFGNHSLTESNDNEEGHSAFCFNSNRQLLYCTPSAYRKIGYANHTYKISKACFRDNDNNRNSENTCVSFRKKQE